MHHFTGNESVADILKLALSDFSAEVPAQYAGRGVSISIWYSATSVPFLKVEGNIQNVGSIAYLYQLDTYLHSTLSECTNIFLDMEGAGFFAEIEDMEENRSRYIFYMVHAAMGLLLRGLVSEASRVFEDNLMDARFLTESLMLYGLGKQERPLDENINAKHRQHVRDLLSGTLNSRNNAKRDYLTHLLNSIPQFNLPTTEGRPKGTKKTQEKKKQEAAQFAEEIENAIRIIFDATGYPPTRTEVARFLKPGVNLKTGTDSRLSVFTKKCKHLKVDFDAIVTRVCGLPK